MDQDPDKARQNIAATAWSLLIIVCLLLVVAHLIAAIRDNTLAGGDLIEQTFTTAAVQE